MRLISYIILLVSVALALPACKDLIGDSCSFDADCSPNMNRNCDRSQPGGYCLIIGCEADKCPDRPNQRNDERSACVEFTTPCPVDETGAVADDELCERLEPNRVRSYCLRRCDLSGGGGEEMGCRGGYQCIAPADMYGVVLDGKYESTGVCVPDPNKAD